MSLPRTLTKRIYLDTIFSRSTTDNSNHWVGTTLKAYRVLATNNNAFDLSLVADPDNGSIKGIPLGKVRLHNYATIANNAVLENSIVQAGVWVDILFSVEDELVWTGEQESGANTVNISEGSNHSSQKVTVTNVTSEIIPANDQRIKASLQHKSGGSIWVGNPAELANADFMNICHEIKPGETLVWKNIASLNAKSDSSAVFSLVQEVV